MLLTKVNMVLENQKQIFQMLASLNSRGAGEQRVQEGLQLEPCASQEDFREFEDKLQDKQFFQQALLFLSLIGGRKMGENTRRTMLAVATNQVWCGYSLFGKKKKAKLCDLRVYKLIKRAVKASLPGAVEKDIEVQIMEVLKHAPQKVRREADAAQRTTAPHTGYSDDSDR
ncbi:uncharacterized protein LOC144538113 isoform X2 [Centroberyx gerrardi]